MAPQDDHRLPDGPTRLDVNRRSFLKTIGVTSVAATIAAEGHVSAQPGRPVAPTAGAPTALPDSAGYMNIRQEVADDLRRRGIVGYADRLRVQPGEAITFMVSSEAPRYRSEIVRLVHGDPNPRGPGIKEAVVEAPVNGDYDGRHQDLPLGSYITVPDHAALRLTGSFSFLAWIAPTTQRLGAGASLGAKGLLTKWMPGQGGYAVVIDEAGRLALWLGDGSGRVTKAATDVPLRHASAHARPGLLVRTLGLLSACRGAKQHRQRRQPRRHHQPARPRRHGLSGIPKGRGGLRHELDRLVRIAVIQQLHEQRLSRDGKRPPALRL